MLTNTTPAPGIDEQIAHAEVFLECSLYDNKPLREAILATLRKYKEIAEAPKPEPVFLDRDNDAHWYVVQESKRSEWEKWLQIPSGDEAGWDVPEFASPIGGAPNTVSLSGPDLLAYAERMRVERDLAIAHDTQPYPTADAYEKACDALDKHRKRAELAESQRDALVRLMREPDEEMVKAGRDHYATSTVFKVMSAVALRKVGVGQGKAPQE